MHFELTHRTVYHYEEPAAEAYLELRLRPPNLATQTVLKHNLHIVPEAPRSVYTDLHGNAVDFLSIPYSHEQLEIESRAIIQTSPPVARNPNLAIPIQEVRQILHGLLPEYFGYLQFTGVVIQSRDAAGWARRHLKSNRPLGEAIESLNNAIHREFEYESGATEISTPLATVWKQRKGVCQDFAHVMLAILRTAGIPARYVCGYIESHPPKPRAGAAAGRDPDLVGSIATHAWVEVLVPGRYWIALDPTNNQWCGERHVTVAVGADFRSAAPVRGTFKGAGRQQMDVSVRMKRLEPAPG